MRQKKNNLPTAFADRLLAWRASRNLTREAAAGILGVPLRTLERWEQRRNNTRIETIAGIAEKLVKDGF